VEIASFIEAAVAVVQVELVVILLALPEVQAALVSIAVFLERLQATRAVVVVA
jgi:hypothetical protein